MDPYYGQGDKVKLLVALSLADNARSEDGVAWPSLESIAKKARTSIRGAQDSLRELAKDGKIEIEESKGPKGTNLYRFRGCKLCTPMPENKKDPPHSVHPAQRAPRKPAPEKAAEKAAAVCTQTVRNHKEPSLTNTSPSPPDAPSALVRRASAERKKRLPTTEASIRIAKLFDRRLTTAWSNREIKAIKSIIPIDLSDLALVEEYYHSGSEFLRKDLLTFLNNFNGEVDRARAWKKNGTNGHKPSKMFLTE